MHPGKAVQGGIVTVYADMAMALAAQTLCEHGEFVVTSQLSISSWPRSRVGQSWPRAR
jgi:acyl-coenzyme A thioesterase PaaI-like protein